MVQDAALQGSQVRTTVTDQPANQPTQPTYLRARAKPPSTNWPRSGRKVKCPVCGQAGYPSDTPTDHDWANVHYQWHLKCPICNGKYVHARAWWQHSLMHPLPPDFIQALKDLPIIKDADL